AKAYGTIVDDDGLPGEIDYFVFEALSSEQFAGEPFPLTVYALDRFGNTASNFNGSAAISGLVERPAVEIGTHDETAQAPLDTSYNDLRLQLIYLADEVGPA